MTNDEQKIVLLAKNVLKEILNKSLAHGFVIIKREQFYIRVCSIDNEIINKNSDDEFDVRRINVVVVRGNIKKTWFG